MRVETSTVILLILGVLASVSGVENCFPGSWLISLEYLISLILNLCSLGGKSFLPPFCAQYAQKWLMVWLGSKRAKVGIVVSSFFNNANDSCCGMHQDHRLLCERRSRKGFVCSVRSGMNFPNCFIIQRKLRT